MEHFKTVGDAAAVAAVAGSLTDLLPPIAAVFTIIWMIMCIVLNWDKFMDKLQAWWDK
jgi:hypothetical protein